MEKISCLLCNSEENSPLFVARDPDHITRDYYQVVKCKFCGCIYTNPRPIREEISRFYYERYYGQMATYSGLFFEPLNLFFINRRVKRIERFKDRGRVLDIGCGQGRFLRALMRRNFEVFVIEPYGFEDKRLNILKGELREGLFEDSSFDLITLWHVLEHIHDPLKTLFVIIIIIIIILGNY
ncbi:TPA: hypothetical protein DCX15_04720, partial [bacterium]|nr:hypothetical protein [bacterium]